MKRTRWTPSARAKFVEALRKTGNVSLAAEAAGFGRSRMYELRREDPEFAAEWEEAEDIASDALEAEARRRAVDGVRKPVYQGGELVGYIDEYSDTLLLSLLKAHRPEKFKERVANEHTGKNGGPIRHESTIIPDFSRLTDEQLASLREVAAALAGEPDTDAEGN